MRRNAGIVEKSTPDTRISHFFSSALTDVCAAGICNARTVVLQEQAPPVPKSRTYTVKGNVKQTFPQIRVMKQSYPGMFGHTLSTPCASKQRQKDINVYPHAPTRPIPSPDHSALFCAEYTAAPHAPEAFLRRGQEIKVVGVSSKRGFLIVQLARGTMHVPFQLTELKTVSCSFPLDQFFINFCFELLLRVMNVTKANVGFVGCFRARTSCTRWSDAEAAARPTSRASTSDPPARSPRPLVYSVQPGAPPWEQWLQQRAPQSDLHIASCWS